MDDGQSLVGSPLPNQGLFNAANAHVRRVVAPLNFPWPIPLKGSEEGSPGSLFLFWQGGGGVGRGFGFWVGVCFVLFWGLGFVLASRLGFVLVWGQVLGPGLGAWGVDGPGVASRPPHDKAHPPRVLGLICTSSTKREESRKMCSGNVPTMF